MNVSTSWWCCIFLYIAMAGSVGYSATEVVVYGSGSAQVYLDVPTLPKGTDRINLAVSDLQRCFELITGSALPTSASGGLIPFRLEFIDPQLPASASYDDRLAACRDYTITVSEQEILLSAASEVGVSNAIYDVLEQWGCRWVMPGDLGEVVPTSSYLELPIGTTAKSISFDTNAQQWSGGPRYGDWYTRNRMGVWRLLFNKHFQFSVLPPDKYFALHPQWYSLIDGQRVPQQLCLSDPDMLYEYIIQSSNVLNYQYYPSLEYVTAASVCIEPEDNGGSCESLPCKALDPVEGSTTDRHIWFANQLAAALLPYFPDRLVTVLGYGDHSDPPINEMPRDDVAVVLTRMAPGCLLHLAPSATCQGSLQWHDILDEWLGVCSRVYVYNYVPMYWTGGLPCPVYLEQGQSIKNLYQRGVKGFHTETGYMSYGANLAVYYVENKLVADASLDPDEVLEDMCEKFFGTGGQAMYSFYLTMAESAGFDHLDRVFVSGSVAGYDELFTPIQISTARSYLDSAIALTQSDATLSARVNLAHLAQKYLEDFLDGVWSAQSGNHGDFIAAFDRVDSDISAIDAEAVEDEFNAADARTRMLTAKMKTLAKYFYDMYGFVRTWSFLGPFDNDSKNAHLEPDLFPASLFPSGVESCLPAETAGGGTAYWSNYTSPEGFVDFSEALLDGIGDWEYSSAYAAVTVDAPYAMSVRFRMDSFNPFRVYLNGAEVYSRLGPDADRPDKRIVSASLLAGDNTVVFKISQVAKPSYAFKWGLYFRITDSGGNLISGLETSPCDVPTNCAEIWQSGYGMVEDLNEDCHVNLLDFSRIVQNWLRCNKPGDPGCEQNW